MKESILIKNFGPIKEIEIGNIRPFTVLIGESGSGKSMVMKVLVLFRWLYKMLNIRSYLKYANITQTPSKFDFQSYLRSVGLSDYIKDDSEIIYQKGSTTLHYGDALKLPSTVTKDELSLEKMSFISDKRNLIPDILAHNKTNMSFYLNETYQDFRMADDFIKELPVDYLNVKYTSKKTRQAKKNTGLQVPTQTMRSSWKMHPLECKPSSHYH